MFSPKSSSLSKGSGNQEMAGLLILRIGLHVLLEGWILQQSQVLDACSWMFDETVSFFGGKKHKVNGLT